MTNIHYQQPVRRNEYANTSYDSYADCPARAQHCRCSGRPEEIAEGVYAYVDVKSGTPGNVFGANVGVVVGENGVLVVDTLTSAGEATGLLNDIRKITDKPLLYVVNTHYHLDHALGNNVFDDLDAIIGWPLGVQKASSRRRRAHARRPPKTSVLPVDFWKDTRIALPDITFARELSVELGNMEVKIIHPGTATHSAAA